MGILDKLVGNSYQKVISKLSRIVGEINDLEQEVSQLKTEDFPKKTAELKKRLAEANGDYIREQEIMEEVTPYAFALVREASKRIWGERHFDVQVIGGLVLNQGKISEMKTGEGKTLVATLPLYLNALSGRGAHLVTVNDYLSRHQGEGMGEIYHFLGLTTGIVQSNQTTYKFQKTKEYKHYSECDGSNLVPCSRREAYACDITYGTNNEFGFDYLRDNMAPNLDACVQRELHYAIVDEVDSILIDEARTPLIISAPAEESASLYQRFSSLVPNLKIDTDYVVDEKDRAVTLTDSGIAAMEKMLGISNIYENDSISLVHHLEQALKAHALFKRDKDYVVKDGEIIIVDEFTGRLMVGRRYSDGLHQAIEAKEGVEVKRESQTLATISFQNLFRMYKKLAGMTGTAATEAEEFYKIYKLDVVEIPTNKPMVRKDYNDLIYKDQNAKWKAIIESVKEKHEKGQPILVGTVSVEKNEMASKLLKKAGIKHEILNAKNHDREAKIIAKAGLKGSVTVATNMAGRGTDIKLGEGVRELGGLHVVSTERHEARRIDNQLRGRAGRQGDPGSSQFFVALDDDLMRIFGGERIKSLMDRLGLPDDIPIDNKMISKSIESAQKKVEGHNFDIRKHLVEYDDVMNKHREIIYKKRRKILENKNQQLTTQNNETEIASYDNWQEEEKKPDNLREEIQSILEDELSRISNSFVGDNETIEREAKVILGNVKIEKYDPDYLISLANNIYNQKIERYGDEVMNNIERMVYLRTIDVYWVEHLTTMEELRGSIGLRGYGQRDPLVEYKHEAFKLFNQLLAVIESAVAKTILKIEVQVQATAPIRRPLEYHKPDEDHIGDTDAKELKNIETEEQEENQSAKTKDQNDNAKDQNREARASRQPQTADSSGVTTTIRTPGGKTVFERMSASAGKQGTVQSSSAKVGRNDPCPCGSDKKYKKCCGK
ncbi:MAG: preprotein translocase subunit SecA [bacterium ADurb.Bin212]|nr:MAG: preprotein translocase subunit SecA [bacterium ADurb.Bin212]